MFDIIKKYCPILLLMLLAPALSAQDTAFFYTFGGYSHDHCRDMTATTDGGYVIVGATSSFGNGASDVYLFKIDSLCNYVWSKTIGGTNVDWGTSIQPTYDNGFIISGYTNSFGAGGYDCYLIKTDSSGNTLWTKTYGGADWDFANSVKQTPDSGYILVGETYSFGNGGKDIYVIRTDPFGNTIWQDSIGGINDDIGYNIINTVDSSYMIIGSTASKGNGQEDIYIVKLDQQGNMLWDTTYGDVGFDAGYDILQTADSGFVILGTTDSYDFNNRDFYLIKTNNIGDTLWTRLFDSGLNIDDDEPRRIYELSNGDFIFIGYTKSFGFGEKDFRVIVTNQSGWWQTDASYGGFLNEEAFAIHVTANNEYIIAGTNEGFGAGLTDVLIIKTDTIIGSYVAVIDTIYDPFNMISVTNNSDIVINIYPNPFNTFAIIEISQEFKHYKNLQLSFYDITGRQIMLFDNINTNKFKLDKGALSPGMYIYVLSENNVFLSKGKLIVN